MRYQCTQVVTVILISLVMAGASVVAAQSLGDVSLEFFPAKGNRENAVVFSFKGRLDKRPIPDNPSAVPSSAASIETFLSRLIQANRTGNEDEILELWSPDERKRIHLILSNENTAQANKAFFQKLKRSEIKAEVQYGAYSIVFVEHSGDDLRVLTPYIVKRIGSRLFQTNDLEEDPMIPSILSLLKVRSGQLTDSR